MTAIRLRFWLSMMDLCHALGWRDAYLLAIDRASDCVDWELPGQEGGDGPW